MHSHGSQTYHVTYSQYDYHMNRNAEVRLDGIAAQASAQSNRTFSDLSLNKLALLVVRRVVRSKREQVRKAVADAKDAADDRKLFLREQKAEARMFKERADHARAIIEWDVEPHHTQSYIKKKPSAVDPNHKSIEGELKGASLSKRKEVLKQNYHCITTGWGCSDYKCCFSGPSQCKLCRTSCGGDTAFKSGGHMEVDQHKHIDM